MRTLALLIPCVAFSRDPVDGVAAATRALVTDMEEGRIGSVVKRFSPVAFRSPVTRQIECFTGRSAGTGGALRREVELLGEIARQAPSPEERAIVLRQILEPPKGPPANRVESGGFGVWMIDGRIRTAFQDSLAEHGEAAAEWLLARTKRPGRVALVLAAPRAVPIGIVWERVWRGWRVIGFAVYCG